MAPVGFLWSDTNEYHKDFYQGFPTLEILGYSDTQLLGRTILMDNSIIVYVLCELCDGFGIEFSEKITKIVLTNSF